ncbi:LacI family DNA-binding transcriptional regulator [Streptomyces alanosinicus]|uniref:LacI family transcriptional regulator n=1 Tax=Streptomyces alanosinicus TaxID=68171 RepID=A0A918YPT0_9ACTN|nr:LacI family DNA-binding transcriptional regulator [Streptomyces alanosinicus]GHE10873.1 LacI family transcriptional regulator [Streptomyces alanosinicus]
MAQSSRKINMADVARAAGVSMATASRALNNDYGVAEATRRRVLAVAEELSYVVSPEASRLAGGATGRVAVVVPHISRWFFATLLEGLESVLRAADLDVLLYHVDGIEDRHDFFHRLPARRKVDAVVVLAFPVGEEEQRRLELMGVTIVAAGGQHAPYPNVCIDDETAARQAMDHLLFLGHRRIAMIAAVDPDQPDEVQPSGRSNAYYAALRDAGIPVDEQLVETVNWGGTKGADAMAKLLSLREPPTAVYAHSDEVALGAVRTLRRAGLRIPEDVSVIGIDDHPVAELTDLTTVRQPVREQGELAGRMLLRILRGEETEHDVVVPTQLVIRGSTAPPRS